jgi:hypothetical protein
MAMEAIDIKQWLEANFEDHDVVAIDEGGLSLIADGNPTIYLEVGGESDPAGR